MPETPANLSTNPAANPSPGPSTNPVANPSAAAPAGETPKVATRLETLESRLRAAFGEHLSTLVSAGGELTMVVRATHYLATMTALRDRPEFGFDQLLDLCGVDYQDYGGDGAWDGLRFAAVSHLLSLTNNWRLRLRVFAPDDDFPVLASITEVWNAANWYEREAFDLYGIVFEGHNDLRRLLTDYGFVGHPFRKDFPVSGNVEMRYDPEQKRVIYQPVTIEPREVVPRDHPRAGLGGSEVSPFPHARRSRAGGNAASFAFEAVMHGHATGFPPSRDRRVGASIDDRHG